MTEPYRRRSPETWDAARDAYLDGATAEDVCARFDLGLSAFRKRAREQGWRRLDQDDPDPEPFDAEEDLPELDDEAFAALAFRRMSVEARRGRLSRALAWGRIREMVLRQITDQARLRRRLDRTARNDSPVEPHAVHKTAATIAAPPLASARDLHEVHEVHAIPPVSRADRRSLAAQARKTGPP